MITRERLKRIRKEKKMTLEDVANGIGVSKATILKYESGKISPIPTARMHELANFFDVSRPYLEGWTDDPKANPFEDAEIVRKKKKEASELHWNTLSALDCTTAASQAARVLIKYGIGSAPIYPHKVLQESVLATMVSFSEQKELDELIANTRLTMLRRNDVVMSTVFHNAEGKSHYIFAVNRDSALGKTRLALAVELGHFYMGTGSICGAAQQHDAECFALHFEFPRALIQLLLDRGYVFTRESFQRVFGDCEWCMDTILNAEPVKISPELNAMVKERFVPHVNLLEETGILAMPAVGEELDLSRYMGGYEE